MDKKGFTFISLLAVAAGIILLATIIFYFSTKNFSTPKSKLSQTATSTEQQTATTTTLTTTTSTPKTTTKKSTTNPYTGLTYTQAVNLFQNRRIQFINNCQMNPASITFKNGTDIMFDNRMPTATNFYLDGTKYSLAGYGFKILNLKSKILPHTIRVDCGTGVNNGQILLQ